MQALILVLVLLAGCITEVVEQEDVLDKDDLEQIGLSWCKSQGYQCGHVWECENMLHADLHMPMVEVCVWDEIPISEPASYYGGTCHPTMDPRFDGLPNLCFWCCGDMCPRGCNAYDGCFCPATEMP